MGDPAGVAETRQTLVARRRSGLRRVAPALAAFVAVRLTGLLVLAWSAEATGRDAHRLLVSWDAQWYAGIAEHGYGFVRTHPDGRLLADYAFFPLYPMLDRVVTALTGLDHLDAGLLVSWVASVVAAWGIFAVGDHLYGARVGLLLTVLWAALPVGIVTSMAYSEALFTALAAWALYALLTGRWVWAGLLASLAGLTRPLGVAVVVAVVVSAALAYSGGLDRRAPSPSSRRRIGLGAAVAPLGMLGYVGWVGYRTGSPTGYFEVAGGWGNGFDGGAAFAGWVADLLTSSRFVLGLMVLAGVAVLVALLVWGARTGLPVALLVFCGVLVFLALTTSGYFGSKPRYLLPAFPLLLPLAAWLAARRTAMSWAVSVVAAAVAAAYGAVWLLGPGPP